MRKDSLEELTTTLAIDNPKWYPEGFDESSEWVRSLHVYIITACVYFQRDEIEAAHALKNIRMVL